MKENIRPIYSQLQGYLKQLPKVDKHNRFIKSSSAWEGYHKTLDRLSEITGEKYDDFKLEVETGHIGIGDNAKVYNYVKLDIFSFQLGGLISNLHGKYFSEERNPLDGTPSTIINTTQNQTQTVKIEIAIEMNELITSKMSEYKKGTKERKFLEQVKDGLKSGKSVVELINLILSTGEKLGLAIPAILHLLSK
jgi:hypothetical protein